MNFSIEHVTERSMMENAHTVEQVSVERIVGELKKTYAGNGLKSAKEKLVQAGLMAFIPLFKDIDKDEYMNSHVEDFMDELITQSVKNDTLIGRLRDLKIGRAHVELVKHGKYCFSPLPKMSIPEK